MAALCSCGQPLDSEDSESAHLTETDAGSEGVTDTDSEAESDTQTNGASNDRDWTANY